jgi:beta-fructofuranosidase
VDVLLNVRAGDPDDPYEEFVIWFAQDERFHCSLRYRPKGGTLKINRIHAGSRRAYVHHRKLDVPGAPTELQLRLVLDKHSVEVFINGGTQAMTMIIPTDLSADAITFFSRGKVVMDVDKYDLA